jgi:hypothetical protein
MTIGFTEHQYGLLKAVVADSDFTFASLIRKVVFDPCLPHAKEETEWAKEEYLQWQKGAD